MGAGSGFSRKRYEIRRPRLRDCQLHRPEHLRRRGRGVRGRPSGGVVVLARASAPELLLRLTAADLVIAHNAQFDLRKLCGTLEHFGLPCPGFDVLCTYRTAQRVWPELPSHTLGALAEYIGHQFDHHHAQADAEAAGRVLLALMQHAKVQTPVELARSAGMELAHMGEGATGSS